MKNYLIGGVVGLLFLAGGFGVGLRLAPLPAPKKNPAVTASKMPVLTPEAISLETLRKTTEGMMDVNQALQARERAVTAQEQRVHEEQEELTAERAALDRSHDKFKELYSQFQQRLELVDNTEQDQLQRQVVMYNAMDPAQSIDLIRGLDDSTVTRLFSIMEVKPLAKLVSAWKAKYAADAPRLLSILDGMGRVVPKEKMTMPDGASTADATSAPAPDATPTDSPAAPVADTTAPAATPDVSAPAAASDTATADTSTKPDSLAPPSDSPTPAAAQDAPASEPAAHDSSASADPHADAATTPPPADSPDGVATAKNN